jgi:hypothetical protein
MSNLIKLIAENNLKTFGEIKSFLSQPPYFIESREDKPVSNLYLLFYTEDSDINNLVVQECNGIILDKNTNQIVSYGVNRVFSMDEMMARADFIDLDWDKATYNKCFDGTFLKVYFYNDKWNVSTTKCINSDKSKWASDKSFYNLFLECNVDLESLDKNNCYCFILHHPESRIVSPVPFPYPYANLVAIRNMNTLELTKLNFPVENIPCQYKFDFVKKQPYSSGSYLVYIDSPTSEKLVVRVDSLEYEWVKHIRGNVPDIKMRYLEILHMNLEKYGMYQYFPEHSSEFNQIESDLLSVSKTVQNLYFQKYITKENPDIPVKYSQTVRQLHGQFKKTKCITTFDTVLAKLVSLPPPVLYWVIVKP